MGGWSVRGHLMRCRLLLRHLRCGRQNTERREGVAVSMKTVETRGAETQHLLY